jgi:hypothetical protein
MVERNSLRILRKEDFAQRKRYAMQSVNERPLTPPPRAIICQTRRDGVLHLDEVDSSQFTQTGKQLLRKYARSIAQYGDDALAHLGLPQETFDVLRRRFGIERISQAQEALLWKRQGYWAINPDALDALDRERAKVAASACATASQTPERPYPRNGDAGPPAGR